MNALHVEQTKNLHEQNFEPLRNVQIAILDEDKESQQTSLNSKHVSVTILFNVLILSLLNFIIVFHTCKEIFYIFVYIIYSITGLAIMILVMNG